MPGSSTNTGVDQSQPAQSAHPEAKDIQGTQDQMIAPATSQQQSPSEPAHTNKRPRPLDLDTTEASSSQPTSSRTPQQDDEQQEQQPLKQQRTLPLLTPGGLPQPDSQDAGLESLGAWSSSAGGAGTSTLHVQLALVGSSSLNSPFSGPIEPQGHSDALAAQPPAASSGPAHAPGLFPDSQQEMLQQLSQEQQLLGLAAALVSPSSSLDLGDQLPMGAVHAAAGQGLQAQQQQQQLQVPLLAAPAASGDALAAAPAVVEPPMQPAAAAGAAVVEDAAAAAVDVEEAAGVVAEAEAAAAGVILPPPAAVAVVEAAAAAAAGSAVVEAAAAAVVQPPQAAVAVANAVPAAVADALPAAGAPQLAPVAVEQSVAQFAHAVASDWAKRYAGSDVGAAAAVLTASVGQSPKVAAAAAEAAALHIAAVHQGRPELVAAAYEAAQEAVYACEVLCDDPLLLGAAQPGPGVIQVPDADDDGDDGDEDSDCHIATYKHSDGMVEYWGVFPTRVLAVEAANAAWLAHNLGLDDEQQVGSMLEDPEAKCYVSESVAELVGPHFLH